MDFQWVIRGSHPHHTFYPNEINALENTWFSIKIHHGGHLVDLPKMKYVNGKINYIDGVDADEFSIFTLGQMCRTLGYLDDQVLCYNYKVPGLDLDYGLRPLLCHNDVTEMCGFVKDCKVIEIYVENEQVVDDQGGPSHHDDSIVDYRSSDESEDDDSMLNTDLLLNCDLEDINFDLEVMNYEEQCLNCDPEGFESLSDEDNDPPIKSVLKKLKKKKIKAHDAIVCPFYVGQSITDKNKIKSLVESYALNTRRQLILTRNEKLKFRVVCEGTKPEFVSGMTQVGESSLNVKTKCTWVLYCSRKTEADPFVVKTLIDKHLCLQTRDVKLYTISFIAKEIEPIIQSNPTIPLSALQDLIKRKHQVEISLNKTFKAKKMAIKKMEGDYTQQYGILREYGEQLLRSNPSSTVKVDVQTECNPASPTRKFKRIYICLGALKAGFKCVGREILGLDGCFMKGPFPGQILTAVGVDANNSIYPVAYSIVEAETRESWKWFLELLGEDLDLQRNSNFTFISDRQKGLIPAIQDVFPSAEHRFCVRHIHENMRIKWRGQQYKHMFWKCAGATTIPEFNKHMEEIKSQDSSLYDWLIKIPASSWARSHFTGRAKCDVLLNNWCEVFNKQLCRARDKPILTCLEYIREYLMKRIAVMKNLIEKSPGPLTPTITKQFDAIKRDATQYTVIMAGGSTYQVNWNMAVTGNVVDVKNKTCSCRKWELSGLPCSHAVAVIWNMAENGIAVGVPESWVDEVYWLDTWKKTYENTIEPVPGMHLWTPSSCPTNLTPPQPHTQPGRPQKKRKKSKGELEDNIERGGRMTRKGHHKLCKKCKQTGHNSRTCNQASQNASQGVP